MRKFRQKGDGDDAVMAAMRSELALLRDENAQLRLEHQQHATPAVTAARLATLVDTMTRSTDQQEAEWATLSEALVLRESLNSVCDELERTIYAVRRQLQSATPTPELDRRRTDRRGTLGAPAELEVVADPRDSAATCP